MQVTWAKTFLTTLFVLVLIGASATIGLSGQRQFFGWQMMVVKSGSMEPSLPTGSLVLTKQATEYGVGDIITFRDIEDSNKLITHRIVSNTMVANVPTFVTKGDANNAVDVQPVSQTAIIGKVLWFIPLIGYALSFLQTPLGAVIFVVIPGTILIYEEIKSLHRHMKASLSKNVVTSALIVLVLGAFSVPPTFAAYFTTTTVSPTAFSTTQWLFPSLLITQNLETSELNIEVSQINGADTVDYSIFYTHVVEGSEVEEHITGSVSKPSSDAQTTSGPVYIGTCSELVCTAHTEITNMEVTVHIKAGSSIIDTLTQQFEWVE